MSHIMNNGLAADICLDYRLTSVNTADLSRPAFSRIIDHTQYNQTGFVQTQSGFRFPRPAACLSGTSREAKIYPPVRDLNEAILGISDWEHLAENCIF
ncbi:hypothetical protein ElyMa_003331900 [Elysia marginata]|uniref:Uncharacterized protein n=1 Tax=Elysia marginata TaxID=1093978 RepID=A0AAV4JIA9_9GAST|nr:hypothetical protein ElyMa_003331900 [Elysia marginata]